jgi:hypothetical protein
LLLPAIQAAREAARRAQCQSNLKNVALAVLNYESSKKILPIGTVLPVDANGVVTPTIQGNADFRQSWAVEILPYIENQPLFDSLVFENASGAPVAMRDAVNSEERATEIAVMLCPSDPNNRVKYQGGPGGANWARGNYAANVGAGHMHTAGPEQRILGPNSPGWNGRSPSPPHAKVFDLSHRSRGVMGPNVSSTIAQITDGTSKTMMLAEIRAGVFEGDSRGTWAFGHAGGNLVAAHGWGGDSNGPNYCGENSDDIGGTGFSCADDHPTLQRDCMTCFGPGSMDQATSRSAHVGGVFLAMCDGSVQFTSDDIETSGPNGACCKAWDHLIASQDSQDPGQLPRPPRP